MRVTERNERGGIADLQVARDGLPHAALGLSLEPGPPAVGSELLEHEMRVVCRGTHRSAKRFDLAARVVVSAKEQIGISRARRIESASEVFPNAPFP